jgi:hypothetical protein
MLKNVGNSDRNIRIGLGIVIIIAGVALQSWWGLIGLVPLLTAGLNFCPLYSVLGISTRKK